MKHNYLKSGLLIQESNGSISHWYHSIPVSLNSTLGSLHGASVSLSGGSGYGILVRVLASH